MIDRIIRNDIPLLVINYPFTFCDDNKKLNQKTNPFFIANAKQSIKRIEFEVLFGPDVKSLDCAFNNFTDLEFVNIKHVEHITSMKKVFKDAVLFNQNINEWNTSNVTNMSCMFSGARLFNKPLSSWNTSKVTDMSCMFHDAISFNQPIGMWDTSSVRNLSSIFHNALSFNQDISRWNTKNVEILRMAFWDAREFNKDISSWKLPKIRYYNQYRNMFNSNARYSFKLPIPLTKEGMK